MLAIGTAIGTVLVFGISTFAYKVSQKIDRKNYNVPDRSLCVEAVSPVAVFRDKSADFKSHLQVAEIDTPFPSYGQVLVRVERAAVNPSDIGSIAGTYGSTKDAKWPRRCGFEGSGMVVASGGGPMAWYLVGKRVACVMRGDAGMWGQYVCVPAEFCMILPDNVSYEEGCSSFVNPLTVLSFVDICEERKLKSMVHTAALSALGKMLLSVCQRKGIELICIVRRAEQAQELTQLGARHVLVSTDKDFVSRLRSVSLELNCRIAFDAVGGELTGQLISALPPKSEVLVYGGLALESIRGVTESDLIFSGKRLSGFWLTSYLAAAGLRRAIKMRNTVRSLLKTDLKTTYRATYALKDVPLAISDYVNGMSSGKVAIAPQT
jgi:NADPH:quinone reductase-like Zn-dependent oxidoreductase